MKDVEEFMVWYHGLTRIGLIDSSTWSIENCTKLQNCTACKARAQCPIRPFFYLETLDSEKLKEYILNELTISALDLNEINFVYKKQLEICQNPKYSCEYSGE